MSEWRADPLTGQWTIVAGELPLTRRDYVVDGASHPLDAPCPLCEGRELMAGPEIAAVRKDSARDGPGWAVRVIPNRVPAVRVEAGAGDVVDGLWLHRPGLGAHEVVVETPVHDATWFTIGAAGLAAVLTVWRDRMVDLRRDERLLAVVPFKNHGAEAGVRLVHPHSQIIAAPIVPPRLAAMAAAGRRHAEATSRCLICDLVRDERAAGVRVVAESPAFLAVAPYASRTPFELSIVPIAHAARFDDAADDVVQALAELLQHVLDRVAVALDRPAFNAVVLSAPADLEDDRAFHWHLALVPRVLRAGGLDLCAGVPINPVAPEEAARVLRHHPA
jgi:UDPglucose--hexose-1-phosphate uridylyltransferase